MIFDNISLYKVDIVYTKIIVIETKKRGAFLITLFIYYGLGKKTKRANFCLLFYRNILL